MTIETKYSIGDEVWFETLGNNYNSKIRQIKIDILPDGKRIIRYNLHSGVYACERQEDELFPTEEELLKSL